MLNSSRKTVLIVYELRLFSWSQFSRKKFIA